MTDPTRPGHILVVDDEADLLDALCDALREDGFAVTGLSDPAAALAAVLGGWDRLVAD